MRCISWRIWIRQLIMSIYSLILIVALVLIALDLNASKVGVHVWGWFVGGLFVLFSIPISIWGILQHVIHYNKPSLQRREIRIMWMVPIYSADAWLALRFPYAAIYLDTLRECYEAYVIYNFLLYLMAFLWEQQPFLERDLMQKPPIKLTFPFCMFPTWNGKQLLNRCKHGVLQYTIIRPVTTGLALICELEGVYNEGEFAANAAWPYLTFINSVSQTWALYCLVLFYNNMKEDLKALKPLKKFLCIKFVIFLSFWQSVLIAILVASNVIQEQADWVVYDTKKMAAGIQDFAICVEMFFAAILHYFAFPHHPYINPDRDRSLTSFAYAMRHMFDIDDVTNDFRDHVRVVGKVATRTLLGSKRAGTSYGSASTSDYQPLIKYTRDEDTDSMCVSFEYQPNRTGEDNGSLMNFAEFSTTTDVENTPAGPSVYKPDNGQVNEVCFSDDSLSSFERDDCKTTSDSAAFQRRRLAFSKFREQEPEDQTNL